MKFIPMINYPHHYIYQSLNEYKSLKKGMCNKLFSPLCIYGKHNVLSNVKLALRSLI